ncbi:MAG: ABC transporter substrate-binding protein [Alphaproteobacteria bacterium]|nr:ABC transporter substrate-binding protein [Alphaproteobacteria bacterium]
MTVRRFGLGVVAATVAATGLWAASAAAQEQFIPLLTYRSGPFAPSGIPSANGFADYLALLNERDGGINGIKVTWEECETQYNNDRGVECYERLKNKGPTGASLVNPYSTGITYAILERAQRDKIPILSLGYGRTDAADGRVWPYAFPALATYWSNASAIVNFIAQKEGGHDKLKGKKIGHLFLESAYGREPIPVLQALAQRHGFELHTFPVSPPGNEQKAVWLQIGRQVRPDWLLMWGWGVMNATAVKEAAAVGYPRNKFIGVWWSGDETTVIPAGDAAKGYIATTFGSPGALYPVHRDIGRYVYDKGKGHGPRERIGEVLYNNAMVAAVVSTEAIRTAQGKYGVKSLRGEEVRWGLENLTLNAARINALGLEGVLPEIKLSCLDHEGGGWVRLQQWDGKQWKLISDWIAPDRALVRGQIEASAAKYAAEKQITPRDCSKEG